MTMTVEEIVRHWRQSRRQARDITILAQLNLVSPQTIRNILAESGEVRNYSRRVPNHE